MKINEDICIRQYRLPFQVKRNTHLIGSPLTEISISFLLMFLRAKGDVAIN